MLKKCDDCKYCKVEHYWDGMSVYCYHDDATMFTAFGVMQKDCYKMRENEEKCGIEAKLFKAREEK